MGKVVSLVEVVLRKSVGKPEKREHIHLRHLKLL